MKDQKNTYQRIKHGKLRRIIYKWAFEMRKGVNVQRCKIIYMFILIIYNFINFVNINKII
jgi:hypothetical protein